VAIVHSLFVSSAKTKAAVKVGVYCCDARGS